LRRSEARFAQSKAAISVSSYFKNEIKGSSTAAGYSFALVQLLRAEARFHLSTSTFPLPRRACQDVSVLQSLLQHTSHHLKGIQREGQI
jgi:hypothetical protein